MLTKKKKWREKGKKKHQSRQEQELIEKQKKYQRSKTE
jgi:hypothetical protein